MTKLLLVLSVSLALTACSENDKDKDSKKKPGYSGSFGTSEDEKVLVEDNVAPAACGSENATNLSLQGSSWTRSFSTNVMNYRQTLIFLNDRMINQVDCSVNGVTARAEISAIVNYIPGVAEIQSTGTVSKTFATGDQQYVCQANLNPALSFTYSIRPSCLVIENGEEVTVFNSTSN